MKNPTSRFLALLTVSALSATALLHPVPAHASKAKTYKYGAIALGVGGRLPALQRQDRRGRGGFGRRCLHLQKG